MNRYHALAALMFTASASLWVIAAEARLDQSLPRFTFQWLLFCLFCWCYSSLEFLQAARIKDAYLKGRTNA